MLYEIKHGIRVYIKINTKYGNIYFWCRGISHPTCEHKTLYLYIFNFFIFFRSRSTLHSIHWRTVYILSIWVQFFFLILFNFEYKNRCIVVFQSGRMIYGIKMKSIFNESMKKDRHIHFLVHMFDDVLSLRWINGSN